MSHAASDALLALVFSALIVALAYPVAAPVIASANTGAALDLAAYLSSLDLSMVPEFWTSGSWAGHVPFIVLAVAVASLALYGYMAMKRLQGNERSITASTGTPTSSGGGPS